MKAAEVQAARIAARPLSPETSRKVSAHDSRKAPHFPLYQPSSQQARCDPILHCTLQEVRIFLRTHTLLPHRHHSHLLHRGRGKQGRRAIHLDLAADLRRFRKIQVDIGIGPLFPLHPLGLRHRAPDIPKRDLAILSAK